MTHISRGSRLRLGIALALALALDFSAPKYLGSHASWKVLENHFGPGKSWKLKLKVLESPRENILESHAFSSVSNRKQAAIA